MVNTFKRITFLFLSVAVALSLFLTDTEAVKKSVTPFGVEVDLSKQHALIIGINDYERLEDLKNAVYDAWSLKEVLVDHYGYSRENVAELYNEDATYSQINHQLKRLLGNKKMKDGSVLVYFSGHGYKESDTGQSFWLPYDVGHDKEDEKVSAYSEETLTGLSRRFSFDRLKNSPTLQPACPLFFPFAPGYGGSVLCFCCFCENNSSVLLLVKAPHAAEEKKVHPAEHQRWLW